MTFENSPASNEEHEAMDNIDQQVRDAMAADPNYPLGETDALKWAVAFRQTATMANPLGKALRAFPNMDQSELVDIMLGWFANAMASADPKMLMTRDDGEGEPDRLRALVVGLGDGDCLLSDLHHSLHRGEKCPECGYCFEEVDR